MKFTISIFILNISALTLVLSQTCANSTICYSETLQNLEAARQKYLNGISLIDNITSDISADLNNFGIQLDGIISDWQTSMKNEFKTYVDTSMTPLQKTYQARLRSVNIIEMYSNLCLTGRGQQIQLTFTTCDPTNSSQVFKINYYSNAVNFETLDGWYFDDYNQYSNDGNPINLWGWTSSNAKQIILQYDSNKEAYQLIFSAYKKCLQMNLTSLLTELYTCSSTAMNQWYKIITTS